ncbi:hypothetical protein EZV62_012011 [Acer yangbiense]|uniref:Uncharacterized protein n=1 Tax=Acer yangbiense TaxID=1000413 RepID=A0A5C7I799_9ROSI|nr:hypothetical protein EZV62_012011 [Acer yangbiense]
MKACLMKRSSHIAYGMAMVDMVVMVKVGTRSFLVRLKENPAPVTIDSVNNFLGLKPKPKNLNLNLKPQMGKVNSSSLFDGNEFSPDDGC